MSRADSPSVGSQAVSTCFATRIGSRGSFQLTVQLAPSIDSSENYGCTLSYKTVNANHALNNLARARKEYIGMGVRRNDPPNTISKPKAILLERASRGVVDDFDADWNERVRQRRMLGFHLLFRQQYGLE